MEPQRRGQHQTVGSWLFTGLNAKSVIVAVIALSGAYYVTQGKINLGEERDKATNARVDDVYKRLELQLQGIRNVRDSKLETTTYDRDQTRLEVQLQQLSQRQLAADRILMERSARR